jgi:hypothetical protein
MTAAVYLYRMAFDFNDFGGRQRHVLAAVRRGGVLTWPPTAPSGRGGLEHEARLASGRWGAYALVGAGALFMLAPFYFMFVFATHSRTEIFSLPPPLWFGDDCWPTWTILTDRMPVLAQPRLEPVRRAGLDRADAAVLLDGRLRLRAASSSASRRRCSAS